MTPNQIDQMDDAGIVRLLAERVMGWTVGPNHPNHDDGRANSWFSGNEWKAWAYLEPEDTGDDVAFYHNRDAWNPLTDDGDCWQVVDRLVADGALVFVEGMQGAWLVRIVIRGEHKDGGHFHVDPDRRRAVCMSALESVGDYEE